MICLQEGKSCCKGNEEQINRRQKRCQIIGKRRAGVIFLDLSEKNNNSLLYCLCQSLKSQCIYLCLLLRALLFSLRIHLSLQTSIVFASKIIFIHNAQIIL